MMRNTPGIGRRCLSVYFWQNNCTDLCCKGCHLRGKLQAHPANFMQASSDLDCQQCLLTTRTRTTLFSTSTGSGAVTGLPKGSASVFCLYFSLRGFPILLLPCLEFACCLNAFGWGLTGRQEQVVLKLHVERPNLLITFECSSWRSGQLGHISESWLWVQLESF